MQINKNKIIVMQFLLHNKCIIMAFVLCNQHKNSYVDGCLIINKTIEIEG